jgi:hypothetical protein
MYNSNARHVISAVEMFVPHTVSCRGQPKQCRWVNSVDHIHQLQLQLWALQWKFGALNGAQELSQTLHGPGSYSTEWREFSDEPVLETRVDVWQQTGRRERAATTCL